VLHVVAPTAESGQFSLAEGFKEGGAWQQVLAIEWEVPMDVGSLLAALALGFVCGAIARALIPNDAFQAMSGWKSWVLSTALGLLGALVGYFIFTELLGIGDEDKFDWGGVVGALIGSIIVVALASWLLNR
jgi:uncharacterized membrane protein YeaQ/YmgE (transglycosylase-associated protein family)